MSRVGDSTHGIEASQDHDDKEKREERREEREERREKTEDRPQEAARGPQMRPPEVPPEGPILFYAIPPSGGTSGGISGGFMWGPFGDLATAQKHAVDVSDVFFCFSWGAGGVFPKDSMTLRPSRWLAVAG